MGLSACAGFVSNPVVYEPKFSKFEPIKLKVVKVEIIDKSKFVGNSKLKKYACQKNLTAL